MAVARDVFLKEVDSIMKKAGIQDYQTILTYIIQHQKTILQRRKYAKSPKAKEAAQRRRLKEKEMRQQFNAWKEEKEKKVSKKK